MCWRPSARKTFSPGNGARGFCFVCNIDPVVAGLLLPKRALQPDKRDFRCFRGNDGILRNARGIGMCRVNHEAYSLGLDIGGKAIRSAKAAAANRAAQFCRSSGASRKRGDGRDRQGGEGAGKACCFRRSAKDEDFWLRRGQECFPCGP